MKRKFQSLRGFVDLLPDATPRWRHVERTAHRLCRSYGFREVRPPVVESRELFERSVGTETDIVGKEMFEFDSGGDRVVLRPEITASVCRAYIEHGLDRLGLTRLYYIGPAFRRERPQKGRLRQFHQIGIEILGESAPETDVESIALASALVSAVGVPSFEIRLNSLGDAECRPAYRELLVAALEGVATSLCEDCRKRARTNPMRVFDCKNASCRAALAETPRVADHLCDACEEHHRRVVEGLTTLGVDVVHDPGLVRGLDYYVRTAFEIRADGLGSQDTVLGGGRYDGLVSQLGGADAAGLGWAAGVERLLIAADSAAGESEAAQRSHELDAYLVTLGEKARSAALETLQGLRESGLSVMWDSAGHGLGGQMKRAGRSGARFALLVGDDELERGRVTVKDLETGEQGEAPLDVPALSVWLANRAAGTAGS